MSKIITDLDTTAETSQEGTAPMQSFRSPAIPVLPDAVVAPRLGRPARIRVKLRQEEKNLVGIWPGQESLVGQSHENE